MPNCKQPFAVRILSWFTGLASAGMCLSILLVLIGVGPTIMGGERVTRTEWLHIAAPLVATIGILMALICYGLATQKPWSRHVVMTIWMLIIGYAITTRALGLLKPIIMWRAVIDATVFGSLAAWYFYFKANVVEYFHQLRDRHEL